MGKIGPALITFGVVLIIISSVLWVVTSDPPPEDAHTATIECYKGFMSNNGVFVPLGWALLGDTKAPGAIYLCGSGMVLTSVAEGDILNLPRFANAQDFIDVNEKLARDNQELRELIDRMRPFLEDLN